MSKLQEMIAKTKAEEPKKEEPKKEEPAAVVPSEESKEELAAKLGLKEVPQFRVFNFRYEFKTGSKVLKPDEMGIYKAENQEDFDFLAWQVKQGRILFN